ncbi:hypothetical protein C7212DRAFT_328281 [Tuber magnatum]|uniref:Uncharacterized protein n=1 Tax=Tuber magnatum TaxID=42249 RepID=A0A317SII6_9PEZI|nr:hypothetical protein C7212DRAFT_328281 [Tuber magnatum]
MHLRSGKKTIFTPVPPRKRSLGRQESSPRGGGMAVNRGTATALRRPPPDTLTPPYTPVTTKKPDPPRNDWSDLEVVCDYGDGGPETNTLYRAGVPDPGLERGLYVCGVEGGERRGRTVSCGSVLLLWGLAVMVFGLLYARESGRVSKRVLGGHEGVYDGLYLCEWGFLLLRLIRNRGQISLGA